MFHTVLVANRGEIAVRVISTLRRMGIRAATVHTGADRNAPHVRLADVAVDLGAPRAYLDVDRVVEAARTVGAEAIHPGYGFLSENAAFARACVAAGLVFVGPPAAAIEAMGDKISAKQLVERAGVPVVPGRHEPGLSDADLARAADEIGCPVLFKPSAGGGGKGMRRADTPEQVGEQVAAARREAQAAFGDDTLLVERFVPSPRHVEVQVLGDTHGAVVHLGERECSLQRRHQKIVEESPSPLLDERRRTRMGECAVEVARAVGYVGAGTVEFIVDGAAPDEFFFMEMNTRLQVEHPVTEAVTGLDLVERQLRVAAGEPLGLEQSAVRLTGHAVEARVYAEDPARDFLPTGGTVLRYREPGGPGVRVDSGVAEGTAVGSEYDPMLAKVVAHGPDRPTALRRLDAALADTVLLGVTTNVGFLRALLADPDVERGSVDTGLVERRVADLVTRGVPEEVYVAAALLRLLALEPTGTVTDPFDLPTGWRLSGPAWTVWRMWVSGQEPVEVRVRGRAGAAEVVVGDGPPTPASARRDGPDVVLRHRGLTHRFGWAEEAAVDGRVAWLARAGHTWAVREQERLAAARQDESSVAGPLRAPMPGTVTMVKTAVGERVSAGQPLLVVEAMKMEHVVAAPTDGTVTELAVHSGQTVALDQPLATVSPDEGE